MKERESLITRRDFLKCAGCAAVGVAAGLPVVAGEETEKELVRSRVVLIRNMKVLDKEGRISGEIIEDMLDQAVMALLEEDSPVKCWKLLISPEDIVGIKSNVWRYLPTPPELEQAIKKGVMAAGVPEKNIAVDDRGVLRNPVFRKATALINTRPMRTHAWSGVGSLIKNYIMFVDRPPDYHGNSCENLGAIWHLPHVKDRTRLNVLVMLTPQFYSVGPHHFDRTFVWNYGGLLVGTDPVAVDSVGLRIIQAKRAEYFDEERPIKPSAHHIAMADKKHHLGTSDNARIELVRLGEDEGSLL